MRERHLSSMSASAIQSYLSESFIRLFQAQAAQPAPVELPNDDESNDSLITRSIVEFEEELRGETPDLRIAPRYVPRRQFAGVFHGMPFTLMQLSTNGLRIRHDDTLRAGDVARLTLSLQRPARIFTMQARVVWTSIAQRGDGPPYCISGVRVLDAEPLQEAIQHLREARDLHADEGQRRRVQPLGGLTDDEVAAIIRVVRRFNSDPAEASRWYARARLALSDETIRAVAPPRVRDREEVVGVWECLERKLDIAKVASVVTWLRQTRASAAEAQLAM
ncbi:MAG TPA: PilZ domain-containing protein [Thermoanaerobaculia bacterium]|nr:PilZ domain-containing protein [Thermoanaerobaculia bacterium]